MLDFKATFSICSKNGYNKSNFLIPKLANKSITTYIPEIYTYNIVIIFLTFIIRRNIKYKFEIKTFGFFEFIQFTIPS